MVEVEEEVQILGWGSLPTSVFRDIAFSANMVVEVGSAYGRSIVTLAKMFKTTGRTEGVQLYAVDIWKSDRQWQSFLGNIHSYEVADIVKPIRAPSTMAVNQFLDNTVCAVYIDGDHRYQSVVSDILCWLPKVRSEGILFFDDFHLKPVRQAIEDTLGLRNGVTDGQTWIYKKI